MEKELKKSVNSAIDALIDELFAADEQEVKKSMIKDDKPQKETADEAVKEAPKSEDDASRKDGGRPEQISDVPKIDQDGKRAKKYDDAIAEAHGAEENKEVNQVKVPEIMKKSISDSEYAEYQELKKAQAETQRAEQLKKARQDQADLIKSAVDSAVAETRKESEMLRKAMAEQGELIKAMANKPRQSKAITNVGSVEKFQKSQGTEAMSLKDLQDVADELVKSKTEGFTIEHAIELEGTGYVYEPEARRILESAAARRNRR